MDVSSIPVSGVSQFITPSAVKTTSTDTTPAPAVAQQFASQQQVQVSPTAAAQSQAASAASQKQQADLQAALSFKNVYAVSDQEVFLFKDATGAYITRYVSERDNTVRYVPVPVYVRPQTKPLSLQV